MTLANIYVLKFCNLKTNWGRDRKSYFTEIPSIANGDSDHDLFSFVSGEGDFTYEMSVKARNEIITVLVVFLFMGRE